MSTLYMVATPIGNLEDVTLRAIRVLHEVGLIAAEDTRRTKRLLSAHQIKTPLTSYHEHNKRAKLPYLLRVLEHGDVALVSEAGMPGINDPGYDLVLAAVDRDVKVVPVPGPSAIPAALAVSGLTAEQFTHLGFLPRKKGARRKLLQSIAAEPRTIVAFETPHRLRSALGDMSEVLGERRLAICREMTKLHEEVFRGTISQAIEHFAKPRGEFTLVIEGKARQPKSADRPTLDGFETRGL
ncbi:16S rRNA (cytidine(1402)-2'-O)-methyltransferase [Dehalococcoidia bacterium]|nr:16S rRNA (cytidine(1402)-2'-O)-methyltransferase [Dehalococcoidia bacterium]